MNDSEKKMKKETTNFVMKPNGVKSKVENKKVKIVKDFSVNDSLAQTTTTTTTTQKQQQQQQQHKNNNTETSTNCPTKVSTYETFFFKTNIHNQQ
jgi:hypothetical protein